MPFSFPKKSSGQIIKAVEWNELMDQIEARVLKSGDSMSGSLTIGGRLGINIAPQTKLHIAGGLWDVNNSQGDLKIGNDSYQFKIGLALGGGGAGDVRIRAQGGTNRLMLGGGSDDTLTIIPGAVGIGNIAPSAPLHIGGSTSTASIRLMVDGRMQSNSSNGGLWLSDAQDGFVGNVGTSIGFWTSGAGWTFTINKTNHSISIGNASSLFFGTQTRQMLNLWSDDYGIGVQGSTLYFRSSNEFAWHWRGVHDHGRGVPGAGGNRLMALNGAGDLILCARTNPNPPSNNVNWPRALVDGENKLIVNYNRDYSIGVQIGGDLTGFKTGTSSNLFVSGRLYVNDVPFGDHRNVQWDPVSGLVYQDNSTRRSKRNITPLNEKVDFKQILKLQPRRYTRPAFPDKWEIGYIAEEAADLGLNELLFHDELGRPDGFNYTKMAMYLLEILRDYERRLNPDSPYLERHVEEAVPEPDANSKKAEIQAYLDYMRIPYAGKETKEELLEKIEK